MFKKPKLIVFASGSESGGGSGFENLCQSALNGTLNAQIVAVVSNYPHGGVKERADKFNIPFVYFPSPWTAERYQQIVQETGAEFVALSGWLKFVQGLNPKKTFNIHPGPLPRFGGQGMYGRHVHEAVMKAYRDGKITHSAVTMHFVVDNDDYNRGPIIFQKEVPIFSDDTPETLGKRVNEMEHIWQPIVTEAILCGDISWDGVNPESLSGQDQILS